MENKEGKKLEELKEAEMEQVAGGIQKYSLDPDKENDAPKGALATVVIKKIIDT